MLSADEVKTLREVATVVSYLADQLGRLDDVLSHYRTADEIGFDFDAADWEADDAE